MNKHVLVIADIEDDVSFALEKAKDITPLISARLEIIKFIQCSHQSKLTITQQIEQAEKSLSAIISRVFSGRDLNGSSDIMSQVVNSDKLTDWVVKYCQQKTVDLVVKTRHRTESLFHTPTDWQLVRQLPCPMLIASHTKWKTQANILLALDLSTNESKHQQLNALVLSWGKRWSSIKHSQLHAVYSIPIAKPLLELEVVDKNEVELKKSPKAKQKMDELLTRLEMSEVASHITAGPPERNIPHLASKLHGDLVIMGSIGRKGVSGYILGNTAEKVLHNLRTDCLIVKLAHN